MRGLPLESCATVANCDGEHLAGVRSGGRTTTESENMRNSIQRRTVGVFAGLGTVALLTVGCGSADSSVSDSSKTASSTASTSAQVSAPVESSSDALKPSTSAEDPSAGPATTTVKGVAGRDATMTGPIAARYAAATPAEKKILGLPLTGDHNAGTRDSGVVFQQFEGGVITARNADAGTPAYLTWGKIREAWNIERDASGKPVPVGTNGSAGPLGAVTSDVTTVGSTQQATFEHGKVTYNTATDKVTVVVNGKTVPSGL